MASLTVAAAATYASAAAAAVTVASTAVQATAAEKAQKEHNEAQRVYTLNEQKELTKAKVAVLENAGKDNLQSQLTALEQKAVSRNTAGAVGAKGQSLDLLTQGMADKSAQNLSDIGSGRRESMNQIRKQSEALRNGEAARMDTRAINKPNVLSGAATIYEGYKLGSDVGASYDKWKSS